MDFPINFERNGRQYTLTLGGKGISSSGAARVDGVVHVQVADDLRTHPFGLFIPSESEAHLADRVATWYEDKMRSERPPIRAGVGIAWTMGTDRPPR
jgi:hypothetical protein